MTDLTELEKEFNSWEYCLHDKDVNESTGELKKAHIHVFKKGDCERL